MAEGRGDSGDKKNGAGRALDDRDLLCCYQYDCKAQKNKLISLQLFFFASLSLSFEKVLIVWPCWPGRTLPSSPGSLNKKSICMSLATEVYSKLHFSAQRWPAWFTSLMVDRG